MLLSVYKQLLIDGVVKDADTLNGMFYSKIDHCFSSPVIEVNLVDYWAEGEFVISAASNYPDREFTVGIRDDNEGTILGKTKRGNCERQTVNGRNGY